MIKYGQFIVTFGMDNVHLSDSPFIHYSLKVERIFHNKIMRGYFISGIKNKEEFRLSLLLLSGEEFSFKNNLVAADSVLNLMLVVLDELSSFNCVHYFRLIFFVVDLVIDHEVPWLNSVMLLKRSRAESANGGGAEDIKCLH